MFADDPGELMLFHLKEAWKSDSVRGTAMLTSDEWDMQDTPLVHNHTEREQMPPAVHPMGGGRT